MIMMMMAVMVMIVMMSITMLMPFSGKPGNTQRDSPYYSFVEKDDEVRLMLMLMLTVGDDELILLMIHKQGVLCQVQTKPLI